MAEFLYSSQEQKFLLKEWLDTQKIMDCAPYNEYLDMDTVDMIIDETLNVAKNKIAPTNIDGDRIGAQLKDGKVILPESYHTLYHFMIDTGYGASERDPNDEAPLPTFVRMPEKEFFSAANPSYTYAGLAGGTANLIELYGTEEQKNKFLPNMYNGKWSGTMCLTEPDAGSDAGEAITKAIPTDQSGVYKIKGVKCFITGGDHDLTENIIHLILARVEGAASGSKGLSLFIVPKIRINEDGTLGEPNDVVPIALEHKMGLKGSATTMLSFGDNDNCEGYLLGNPPDENGVGEGLRQMFVLMNGARQGTGLTAVGIGQAACNYSVQYAKERIQGKAVTNKKGPRVPIIQHADVRRMLIDQKAQLEAARAIVYQNAYFMDMANVSEDKQQKMYYNGMVEFGTPVVKAYPTDIAWDTIEEAIQVHGGYGYTEEYPVSQCARDEKVLSIWEGTSFIQAQDLVGRKWKMKDNALLKMWNKYIADSLAASSKSGAFDKECELMTKAHAAHQEIQKAILTSTDPNFPGLYATRALHATAWVWGGTLLLEQAVIAKKRLNEISESDENYTFYQGKLETTKYYIYNIVPQIFSLAEIIKAGDTSALEIPEAAL